ncbi:hypothetical protein ACO2J1_02405 [Leptospira interrogans]|uniref:Uncharacterized protein n=5 Tax=Leptospira interrogans TaxID=173 RepID=A0AAP9W7H9_LEPIR|nr:hypothetical protein [Leptospira interrogans]KAA1290537.1 hypothetical protein C4X99_09220 [Leptospira interrogans serovar Geyaweera]AKH75781.1 hypothetical protein BRAT_01045 [Leptospira interrogans serovar Bratislava]ARB96280.1 hypothetical protein A6J42_12905 [Leptospira interrogans serovar Copenhageni]ASP41118.1 hypothetical protein AMR47_01230 [Leptospira interrogans]ASV04964.1 hypothetical protein B2G47_01090 [Leptospira interrogans serovar Canicola]
MKGVIYRYLIGELFVRDFIYGFSNFNHLKYSKLYFIMNYKTSGIVCFPREDNWVEVLKL